MNLLATGFALAGVANGNADKQEPLQRYDPYAESPQFLASIRGKPRLGFPSEVYDRFQRVSDKNWFIGLKSSIAWMEPDYKTGEVAVKQIIEAVPPWSVSQDAKLIFARRRSNLSGCFDLKTGESKWISDNTKIILDACFTADGKQVAILHRPHDPQPIIPKDVSRDSLSRTGISKYIPSVTATVSWHDAQSGEVMRSIELPGACGEFEGNYMAFSGELLYVARPGKKATEDCFVIKQRATLPEKIEVSDLDEEDRPKVAVGGLHGEFIVFHSESKALLYRQKEDGTLNRIHEKELERDSLGNTYDWCSRFTPDGNYLVLSSCLKTHFISTAREDSKEYPQGSRISDFSEDGKFFVSFDDGGGRVRDVSTWEVMESFDSKIHPLHCCPVSEAGFSISGNYIISSDRVKLLLWSKNGQQLAELFSPKTDTNNAVWMQSPVIVEDQEKVFAADGYDFLMWDLVALKKRLSLKPDNTPRVRGEVVFKDNERNYDSPEVMNIMIDSKGENIITALRDSVRYRSLAASKPIQVPVPDGVFMRPRALIPNGDHSSVLIRPGYNAYKLDLTGQKQATYYAYNFVGADIAENRYFSVMNTGLGSQLVIKPLGVGNGNESKIALPKGMEFRPENLVSSRDNKWIAGIATISNHDKSTLVVLDVAKQVIIHTQQFRWVATTITISEDGKRLLIGASNRVLYEFDFLKIIGNQ